MFVERLKQLLKERKLTQGQLLSDLQMGKNQIRYWELGKTKPNASTVKAIADYLSVSPDYLLGKSNDPKPVTVTVGPAETREVVLSGYEDLNDEGRELVADYVSSLRRKPRYVKAAVPTKTVIKRPDGTILVPVRGTPVIEYKGKAMSAKTVVRPKIKRKKKNTVKV